MLVWAHCGMLTLLVQVPAQLQRQKKEKFTTQESQLTSAFPSLSHTDPTVIRNWASPPEAWFEHVLLPSSFPNLYSFDWSNLTSSKGCEILPAASALKLSDQTLGSLWFVLCILYKELFPSSLLINIGCQGTKDSSEWLHSTVVILNFIIMYL